MKTRQSSAFTLVELLVALTILMGVVALLLQSTSQASRVMEDTSGKVEQFRESRIAFETLTRRLADATLNTYWDYSYRVDKGNKIPTAYTRQSELRFRSGRMSKLDPSGNIPRPTHGVFFQTPAGEADEESHQPLEQSLNTWGFFLEVSSDEDLVPPAIRKAIPRRTRSRLYELRQPTESLAIFQASDANPIAWYADALNGGRGRPVRVLAENIVALVILPRLSQVDELARNGKPALSPNYDYDSTLVSNHTPAINPPDPDINPKHQLPPVLQVVMVAIDERSAERIASQHEDEPDLGIQTDDLFQNAALLHDDPATPKADGDLKTLEERLMAAHAKFRIFSTTVAIRGAKWSRAQSN